MTSRRIVMATQSFSNAYLGALVGKHPAVIAPGTIQQRTPLYADDPIVRSNPTFFADALPGADGAVGVDVSEQRRADTAPEWLAIVRAYRSCQRPESRRPSQLQVANVMGFDTEQPLRDRLRRIGIADWRAVHARVAADYGSESRPI